MIGKLILRLEEEQRNIEKSAFNAPPGDYAGFMKLVGARNSLVNAVKIIEEMVKEDDERN